MRIGLLGGSFDPPHHGHLSIINKALTHKLVEEVWLIPTWKNPWKKEEAAPEDRLAMCKLLIKNNQIKVSDVEIKRQQISYTIDTISELKQRYRHQFFWLLGNDHLKDLEKFKEAKRLFEEIIFIAFPRTTVSSSLIKEKIKKNQPISDLVSKEVEQYIRTHNLYV